MDITKKFTKESLIIFLFLAFLPFGQIIRFPVSLFETAVYLNVSDLLAFISLLTALVSNFERPSIWKGFSDFLATAAFSLLFSILFFNPASLSLGLFYFVRLAGYMYMFNLFWNFFKRNKAFKLPVLKSAVLVSVFAAAVGWVQYFMYPDLRSLIFFNWDEHLLRLVGGFLDPTFTGIFLVFGIIISLLLYFSNKKKIYLAAMSFLLASLAFTYSRSSFLALGASLAAIGFLQKKFKEVFIVFVLLAAMIFLLPGGESEGVRLTRVASIYAKVQNYKDSISLSKISPLFGVGYNNICLAKGTYLAQEEEGSHACSGLDSSLLFLLVTTGAAGVFSFINLISQIGRSLRNDIYAKALALCSVALLVHSLFANSLFYSWVLGFIAILLSLSV